MSNRDVSEDATGSLRAYVFIALVALISKGVRLWMLFPQRGWADLGFGWELGQVAANIAQGNGMSSPFKVGTLPTAWFMPVTPLLWAVVFKVFGVFSKDSLLALYGLDCVLRAVAGCVYLKIVSEVLPKGSVRTSLCIATVALLAPEHLVTLTRPWYWGLQEVGVALMLLAALRWYRSNRLFDALTFGITSGVTLLVNSVPVLLLAGLLGQIIVRSDDMQRRVRGALVIALVCLACLTPWIVRNYEAFGAFVPLRQNTWVETRQGNNPEGSIVQSRKSLHPNVRESERVKYDQEGEYAYEASARTQALHYIENNPGMTLKRVLMRATLFWFSDLFHEGVYGERGWSQKTLGEKLRDVWVFLWSVAPILIVLIGIGRACLGSTTLPWILVTPLLVLPLPYYLSHIHPVYFATVKPLLLLLAGVLVSQGIRGSRC